jgi:4-amino-4-deoxy-L-arabinose transferase-like glycosyltransferase
MRQVADRLLPLALFLLALLPRAPALDAFLTADEPTLRIAGSVRFLTALSQREWETTYQFRHPGVTTMWAGTLGLATLNATDPTLLSPLLETALEEREEPFLTLLSQRVVNLLPAVRLPVVVITAASVVGVYLLARRLWGPKVALLSALLVTFDPFFLAHSRLFHTDPLLTAFATLSFLSLLTYLEDRRLSFLILSGLMLGLALLSKVTALVLIPWGAAIATLDRFWRGDGEEIGRLCLPLILWASLAALVFFLLWPAMWVTPLQTVSRLISESFGLAAGPLPHSNFFWGKVTPDPGPLFYPAVILFRATPLTLLGAVTSLFFARGHLRHRRNLAYLWLYILLFTLFITYFSQKLDRYLLPIFPALEITAGVGLYRLAESVGRRFSSYIFPLASVIILVLQTAFALPHHPYYLTYYNPLLGGPPKATQMLLVGWGEGLEQAADYLNQKEASQLKVATWYEQVFRPFFPGQTIPLEFYQPGTVDYVILYINDLQRRLHPAVIDEYYRQEPEYVIHVKGIDYAFIYRATSP